VCIYDISEIGTTETFISGNVNNLQDSCLVTGIKNPVVNSKHLGSTQFFRIIVPRLNRLGFNLDITQIQLRNVIKKIKPDIVLAQYGVSGAAIVDTCKLYNIPLVTYFRGFDATRRDIISKYFELFEYCNSIICVSSFLRDKLIEFGANSDKIFVNPSGSNEDLFRYREKVFNPEHPIFISVGRFVEKKAPHLLLLSFAGIVKQIPQATLNYIGEGHLLSSAKDLSESLGLGKNVKFFGAVDHLTVARMMESSDIYIQHSITAQNGDSEGMPVAIKEAQSVGLPVISTKHSGIADVVIDRETGELVEEKDIVDMTKRCLKIINNPKLVEKYGRNGRQRIEKYFTQKQSLDRLKTILEWSVGKCQEKPLLLPDYPLLNYKINEDVNGK